MVAIPEPSFPFTPMSSRAARVVASSASTLPDASTWSVAKLRSQVRPKAEGKFVTCVFCVPSVCCAETVLIAVNADARVASVAKSSPAMLARLETAVSRVASVAMKEVSILWNSVFEITHLQVVLNLAFTLKKVSKPQRRASRGSAG